jgi:preprotein translocase subunit SecE
VARDRRRDKNRKRRQDAQRAQGDGTNPIHRADEPGSLDHIGSADEADAAIVAGAGGEVADDAALDDVTGVEHPEALSPEEFNELEDQVDEAELEIEASGATDAELELDDAHRAKAHHVEAPKQSGPRFVRFLRASWAELRRVQWPDRRQVSQATAVVLGFVVVAGLYLGVADWAAKKVVDFII